MNTEEKMTLINSLVKDIKEVDYSFEDQLDRGHYSGHTYFLNVSFDDKIYNLLFQAQPVDGLHAAALGEAIIVGMQWYEGDAENLADAIAVKAGVDLDEDCDYAENIMSGINNLFVQDAAKCFKSLLDDNMSVFVR